MRANDESAYRIREGFDPEAFDLDAVNKQLAKMRRRKSARG